MKIEKTVLFKDLGDEKDDFTRLLYSNGLKNLGLSKWLLISSIQSLEFYKKMELSYEEGYVVPFSEVVIEFQGIEEAISLQAQLILFYEDCYREEFDLDNLRDMY